MAGVGNPEWAHVGIGYRKGRLGSGLSFGSAGLAYNLGATLRLFLFDEGGGPYVHGGVAAAQLVETTPGLTPRDVFFLRYLGVGWQISLPWSLVNLAIGLHDPPSRSSAPPGVVISSGLLPHFLAEAGYAF